MKNYYMGRNAMEKNNLNNNLNLGNFVILDKNKTFPDKDFLFARGFIYESDDDGKVKYLINKDMKYDANSKIEYKFWMKNTFPMLFLSNIKNTSLTIGRENFGDLTRSILFAKKNIYIISPYISSQNFNFLERNILKNEDKKDIDCKIISTLNEDNLKNDSNYQNSFSKIVFDKKNSENINIRNKIDEEQSSIKNTGYMKDLLLKEKEILSKYIRELYSQKDDLDKENEQYNLPKINIFLSMIIVFLIVFLVQIKIKIYSVSLLISAIIDYFIINSYINYKINLVKKENNKKYKNKKELKLEINKKIENTKNEISKIDFDIMELDNKIKESFKKIESLNKDLYEITYTKVFKNIEFTEDNKEVHNYPHVKLYIIDDIAYLGSLNFTHKAFFSNIESLIKIEDKEAVEELKKFFLDMYNNKENFLSDNEIEKIAKL